MRDWFSRPEHVPVGLSGTSESVTTISSDPLLAPRILAGGRPENAVMIGLEHRQQGAPVAGAPGSKQHRASSVTKNNFSSPSWPRKRTACRVASSLRLWFVKFNVTSGRRRQAGAWLALPRPSRILSSYYARHSPISKQDDVRSWRDLDGFGDGGWS